MAETIDNLISKVKARTGVTGENYDDIIHLCINRAIQMIGSLDFDFMYNPNGSIAIVSGIMQYPLAQDFRKLDYDHVYFIYGTTKKQLLPAQIRHIVFDTPTATGTPNFFCISGTIQVEQEIRNSIYVGAPISNINGTVLYGYWKRFNQYTSRNDIPELTHIWDSAPIVSGGIYFMWKELEQNAKAQDALIEHLADMRRMCYNLTFSGKTYDQIIGAVGEQ